MATWQYFIIFLVLLVPLLLLVSPRRWEDDRLTFRGRPTQRDWRRQLDPPTPADDHH